MSATNCRVSVIIPIYNVEAYVLQCLQSVANQTMTEGVECILVDDCGTDKSVQIAEDFINSYQGNISFRLIHHEQNSGLSAARNTGIHISKGNYLFFLDSDDEITPDCISILLELAEKYQADLVQGTYLGHHRVLSKFHINLPQFNNSRKHIKYLILDYDQFPVMAQNRLIRKTVVTNNNLYFKEGIIHEDNLWTFYLAKHIQTLAICSTPTYYYRLTPGSITNKTDINKEYSSFSSILIELCENFDPFLLGEQKYNALKILKTALTFQRDHKKRNNLFKCLYNRCFFLEKMFLLLWFKTKNNSLLKDKLFNLCIRVFRLHN